MEKELAELRQRLERVEEWKKRRADIEEELNEVWTAGGAGLAPPPYVEADTKEVKVDEDSTDSSSAVQV